MSRSGQGSSRGVRLWAGPWLACLAVLLTAGCLLSVSHVDDERLPAPWREALAEVVGIAGVANVPISFWTKATAILSPLVTSRKPTVGLAIACVGIEIRVQPEVTVTAVHVAPLSIVMSTSPAITALNAAGAVL